MDPNPWRTPAPPTFVQLNLTWRRGTVFFGGLAQQSLNVGEGVGKLDFGEGVVNYDIGHEQPALINFQPLNLKAEVVGHRFNSSPLGQVQPFP
jgi:hypothetical protein